MELTGRSGAAIRAILERCLEDRELSVDEGEVLCHAQGTEVLALASAADELRHRQVGDTATYVVNRNINFTNVCIKHCTFCAFSRDHHQDEAYFLPIDSVVHLAREARELGATEVCVQAGLAPKLPGWHYVDLVRALKRELPDLNVHAFSPEEVCYGAARAGTSIREYLLALKEAGLGSLPGTSAEILDDSIRNTLAKGRINTATWVDVITTAHDIGLRTTATIMYGHLETYGHWLRHMDLLRRIQKRTFGFTEFVPLSFVHEETPLHRDGLAKGVRSGPTAIEVVKMHALSRLMLGRHFRNIQASWVKEGPKMAQWLLSTGANDFGGTLMNESISTTAGALHGQFLPPREIRRLIRGAGRIPAERSSTYALLRVFADGEAEASPLDRIDDASDRFGSYARLAKNPDIRFRLPQG